MILEINISTEQERIYLSSEERGENYKGDGYKYTNPLDKDKKPENITLNVCGFNYEGSLSPLITIINEFLKQSMVDVAVSKATLNAIQEIKKLSKEIKK